MVNFNEKLNALLMYFLLTAGKYFAIYQKDVHILELMADIGTNITLPCNQNEETSIQWIYGATRRNNMTEITPNGELFLSYVDKNDSGVYECYENSDSDDDNILARIYLHIKYPPVLHNVTITPSSVLALLQWSSIDNGGYPVDSITIRYCEPYTGGGLTWHYVDSKYISLTAGQVDIYKLNPNTTYLFHVWATNKLGPGNVINLTTHTHRDNQEIELAKHLLIGAETFDTRIWIAAVGIVMLTLVILTAGTCFILYRECHIPMRDNMEKDPEKIELIPNVILNPNYYDERPPWKKFFQSEVIEEEHEFNTFHKKVVKPAKV